MKSLPVPHQGTSCHCLLVFGMAIAVAGCKGNTAKNAPAPGSEGGPCLEDETCSQGLVCRSKLCVSNEPGALETDVMKSFQSWLDAQNEGDFDSYSSLYVSDFTGIKRVGEKRTEFGRDDWLRDRKRMFRKKMTVTAEQASPKVDGKIAIVEFIQTWKQGSFKDRGRKRLELRRESETWLIVREEMLSSEVLSKRPAFLDEIRALRRQSCGCSSLSCIDEVDKSYSKWLERMQSKGEGVRALTKTEKRELADSAEKTLDCLLSSKLVKDERFSGEALTWLPDLEKCPKWFDRPDFWYMTNGPKIEREELCRGNF